MIIKKTKAIFIKLFSILGIFLAIKKKKKNNEYELINKKEWIPFLNGNEKTDLYKKCIEKTGQSKTNNFSKQLRFYNLMQLTEHVLKNKELTKRNFAECGCWHGNSSLVISSILKKNNFKNNFYIFDSFEEGLSEVKEQDKNLLENMTQDEVLKQKNYFKSNEAKVKDVLKPFEFVRILNGWIPRRFKEISEQKFSFVHIDVDMFQPTLDSLKFFFPRLEKNGIIICDDYNFSSFPGAKKAWDEYFKDKNNEFNLFYETPFGGCFIIK